MKKQELKEAVGELNLVDTVFEADGVSYIDTAVSVTQVYDLIDQLEEPRKVIIPQFVAEAFEEHRESNLFVGQFIKDMYGSSDEVGYWLEGPFNEKLLLRAWLDGYEVEKEKLYKVCFMDCIEYTVYERDEDGKIIEDGMSSRGDELTEAEIAAIDPRFWPFAVEVAE